MLYTRERRDRGERNDKGAKLRGVGKSKPKNSRGRGRDPGPVGLIDSVFLGSWRTQVGGQHYTPIFTMSFI